MKLEKSNIYKLLEEKMLSYKDYADIRIIPEEDEIGFIPVHSSAVLSVNPINDDTVRFTKDELLLRSAVADRLYWAGQELKTMDRSLRLEIVYGYRALGVQQKLFDEAKEALVSEYDMEDELVEATHRRIAVPDVAGHPTGGAVDVQMLRDGILVEIGTPVWDFSRDAFTFSPFITREAWENRQLLRRAMMAAGFAPFDGEWWHFSYGDKEWARFYGHPGALYDQVAVEEVHTRKDVGILS